MFKNSSLHLRTLPMVSMEWNIAKLILNAYYIDKLSLI